MAARTFVGKLYYFDKIGKPDFRYFYIGTDSYGKNRRHEFYCYECDKPYKNRETFSRHLKKEHRGEHNGTI